MDEETFTIQELADAAGVERRTVRHYVQQGLLPPPESLGRGARYGRQHLERLKAVRALREGQGLSMTEVRHRLLLMSQEEVRGLAAQAGGGERGAPASIPVQSSPSAVEYLRKVRESLGGAWTGEPRLLAGASPPAPGREGARPGMATPGTTPVSTPLDATLGALQALAGGKHLRRRAKGEHWFQIAVTPDIELRIRGVNTPEDLAKFEHIADLLRELLQGGAKDDYDSRS